MKIKQKRKVNYHEFIKWVWKNNIYGTFNDPETAVTVYVQSGGAINVLNNQGLPVPNSRFEIEEEVEIDEDTKLDFIAIKENKKSYSYPNFSINGMLEVEKHDRYGTKFVYLQNEDGSIGEIIWKDREMVD